MVKSLDIYSSEAEFIGPVGKEAVVDFNCTRVNFIPQSVDLASAVTPNSIFNSVCIWSTYM